MLCKIKKIERFLMINIKRRLTPREALSIVMKFFLKNWRHKPKALSQKTVCSKKTIRRRKRRLAL